MVNGSLELEGIVGKICSKRVYETGLFLMLIHHHRRKLRILFFQYTHVSFSFNALFHELIFCKHPFKYLSCTETIIKYTSGMTDVHF